MEAINIKMIPQVRDKDKIWYEIEHQKIKVTINNISDTFDFTDMPDGELRVWDDFGEVLLKTSLPEIPIYGAKKVDGILWVEILFTIDIWEEDERLLFPKPMTLDEFKDLMKELDDKKKEVESDGEDGLEEQGRFTTRK